MLRRLTTGRRKKRDVLSFPPFVARKFSSRERRLDSRWVLGGCTKVEKGLPHTVPQHNTDHDQQVRTLVSAFNLERLFLACEHRSLSSLLRLQNSRFFSQNRFCKVRSAGLILSREVRVASRAHRACVARREKRIFCVSTSFSVFTLTPVLSLDFSRARS